MIEAVLPDILIDSLCLPLFVLAEVFGLSVPTKSIFLVLQKETCLKVITKACLTGHVPLHLFFFLVFLHALM